MAIILLMLCPAVANAGGIDSSSSFAKGYFNQSFDFDGDVSESWTWNGTVGYSQSTSTSTGLVTKTSDFGAGVGWALSPAIQASGDLNYSRTPEDNLTGIGPNFSFSYKFMGEAAEPNDFAPSLKLRTTLGWVRYDVQGTAAGRPPVRKRGVTVAPAVASGAGTDVAIRQTVLGFDGSWAALEWFAIGAGMTHYQYDRSVPNFQAYLNSDPATRLGVSGMGSAVSGFLENSADAFTRFSPNESWDLTLTFTLSTNAGDQSISRGLKLISSHELSDAWNLSFGAQREFVEKYTTGYFTLGYDF